MQSCLVVSFGEFVARRRLCRRGVQYPRTHKAVLTPHLKGSTNGWISAALSVARVRIRCDSPWFQMICKTCCVRWWAGRLVRWWRWGCGRRWRGGVVVLGAGGVREVRGLVGEWGWWVSGARRALDARRVRLGAACRSEAKAGGAEANPGDRHKKAARQSVTDGPPCVAAGAGYCWVRWAASRRMVSAVTTSDTLPRTVAHWPWRVSSSRR